MTGYKLPKGFRWTELCFEHAASGKRGAVTDTELAVGGNVQAMISYACAKTLRELARDQIYVECGRDIDAFRQRGSDVDERFRELLDAAGGVE